jgi:G3E family GTPase
VLEALVAVNIQTATVVGIIDAAEFMELHSLGMYGHFFNDQVTRSDVVLVNKTDLVDKKKTAETIALVESLNPDAVIIPTVNAVPDRDFLQYDKELRPGGRGHEHNISLKSCTVRIDRMHSLEELKFIFEMLASGECGNIVRAKALVQTGDGPYRFDLASKQVRADEFANEIKDSRLVVVGTGILEDKIRGLCK